MTQKVKGFLASDGKFFETEPECQRHEHRQTLIELCESHNINPENFFQLLREWSVPIRALYHADSQCKGKQLEATGQVSLGNGELPEADIPQADEDHEDTPFGDKDAPGFLEQSFGRYK